MRIVTWNMARRSQEAGWTYLVNEIKPDIALLQEVRPPTSFMGANLLYERIGDSRNWGSAIYVRGFPIHDVKIEKYRGWVVACEILLPNNSSLVAISIHAQIINNYVFPNLKNIFSDISPFLQERRFIVGGDLNSCRLIDKVYGTKYHNEFFDSIESGGFFNCHRMFHAEEQQTVWSWNTKYPYQDDHLFVSESLKEQLLSCDVLDNEHIRKLSDHSPVIAEVCI